VYSSVVLKMEDILSIQDPVEFDDRISNLEIHPHQPYTATNYNNSDEIRIAIQHQDLNLLPSHSSLRICGRLIDTTTKKAPKKSFFVNNGICYLFDDARLELNGIEIDRCKNFGLSTLMKNWVSFNPNQSLIALNSGWFGLQDETKTKILNEDGYFDAFIPLKQIFGFAEDYRKIVVNVKLE